MFGKPLTLTMSIENLGSRVVSLFNATIGIRSGTTAESYNSTLFHAEKLNISANMTDRFENRSFQWKVSVTTPGIYQIWVFADPLASVNEPTRANNFAYMNFTLNPLVVSVTIIPTETELKAGDLTIITASILYSPSGNAVVGLPGIQFWLVDPATNQTIAGSNSTIKSSDESGSVTASMRIPSTLDSGTYTLRIVIPDLAPIDGSTQVHVSALGGKPLLPMWLWLVIIIAAVGSVVGFMGYTYKYGLGKLVECGECGQFIPASSKRCPKCGVEFEVGTMKCSECGAWIPAASKECPNCGVKFVGEAEDEADYLERMRAEYEDMVGKYREIAKPELGKKFTDKAFEAWWTRQPGYISFDDWLAKEEEKKKEGTIPCPNCGTLNPKEATVCHKCGTVFGAHKEAQKRAPPPEQGGPPAYQEPAPAETQQTQAQAPQRMVIRRPVDRKVVPKKIIKSPMGGTEGTTEGDQEQQ
jgi:ribosomal protein L40E